MTDISSLTNSKRAPRRLKSGSFNNCFVIPVSVSSVNRVRNSMGWDAAFRRSIRTFELFSEYVVTLAFAVAFDFFVVVLAGTPSSASLAASTIVFRERCKAFR